MAWEDRNGRRYYYRKRRVGGKVRSEYIGSGPLAEAIAAMDEQERRERERHRQEERQEQEAIEELLAEVGGVQEIIRALTRAMLLVEGCHTHHGTWRRKRDLVGAGR